MSRDTGIELYRLQMLLQYQDMTLGNRERMRRKVLRLELLHQKKIIQNMDYRNGSTGINSNTTSRKIGINKSNKT